MNSITEEQKVKLTVEAFASELEFAVEKIQFLTNTLNDDYLSVDWSKEDMASFETKKKEMFYINAMIHDYLSDIRDIKELMEEEFDL